MKKPQKHKVLKLKGLQSAVSLLQFSTMSSFHLDFFSSVCLVYGASAAMFISNHFVQVTLLALSLKEIFTVFERLHWWDTYRKWVFCHCQRCSLQRGSCSVPCHLLKEIILFFSSMYLKESTTSLVSLPMSYNTSIKQIHDLSVHGVLPL